MKPSLDHPPASDYLLVPAAPLHGFTYFGGRSSPAVSLMILSFFRSMPSKTRIFTECVNLIISYPFRSSSVNPNTSPSVNLTSILVTGTPHILQKISTNILPVFVEDHVYAEGPDDPPADSPMHSFAYLDCGNGQTGTRFNAYTYIGDPVSCIVPSFDKNVDTEQTTLDIKSWLSRCTCVPKLQVLYDSRFKPTRIIDIGTNPEVDIIVKSTSGLEMPGYVCLPYAGAGLKHSHAPRQSSTHLNHEWSLMTARPRGSKSDLLQMPNIFKYADLTVCASSSKTCTEGFLQQRPEYSERQITLNLPEGKLGTAYLDSYTWWSPPVSEPLSQRARAYQERLLSPRLLEYGWRTSRLFSLMNPPGVRLFSLSESDLFNSWALIIRKYSALKLTFPRDRLAAISGVAIELQRATGAPYLAGLWDHERLPSFLLWRTETPFSERCVRPDERRAPSWSWSAIDEGVIFQHSKVGLESFKIVDSGVTGDFDQSVQELMKMRGLVRRVRYDQGNIRMMEVELTFIAVGRAHTDHGVIRGLMLLRDKAGESSGYRRVGVFQARDEGGFKVENWCIEEAVVI
ncbi:hypothetical protein B0T10DRAFT_462606 [Thelonectria olida]|uniref:Uncharacterized protein n=1 Tax=Thelonectria olida TaxID=1576542 RepID=A0A9P8VY51_9HYPO|nr:hypothetical protein B0T10DRAFT_462606 [Thelonectria olida]